MNETTITTIAEFLELLNRHSDALIVIFTFVVTLLYRLLCRSYLEISF